ncbi:MAG: PAS domain S-box protein, partial [Anaerolineae bacterium]
MSKEKTGTSSCLSRTGRETDLLYALNVAAASLQRPAHSEAEVFRVSSEQIAKLGLRGGLSLLDETGSRLIIRAVAFPEKTMKLLTTLEKLSGFKARDFEFNVAEVDTYRQVVETGEAEFVANSGAIIAQLLPESARPFARRILKAFGSLPAIFAPLIIEGRVQGILNVVGARLTAGDIPALVAFVNHISVALDNARLFAAMQQTEAQYRCLYESANDGILIIEPVTTLILSANPKAVEMTGYAETELRAMPITALHPAAVAAEAHRLFETVRQQGQAIFELALNRRDGQQLVVQVSATMFEANGRLLMQSMMRDITERKRTEKEIRRRNRELALLNRVIAASAASLEPEDVLEMACRELALAFDVPQAVAALLNEEKTAAVAVAEYLAGGRPVALNTAIPVESNPSFEYLLTHKAPLVVSDAQNDQRLASIHDLLRQRGTVSLLILPLIIEGEVAGSLALDAIKPRTFSTRDVDLAWSVADQVAGALARAQLDRAHRRLSTAIEQAAEGVVITDTEGTILYVNPAFERVSGYSRSEAIGQNPRILKSAKQDAAFYREMWETISAGKIWRGRLVNKKKDGVLYTEETTISPVRDENGAVVNYVAVKRDVTRELQLEEQYRQAQKMEAIGRLTGGIAHDFNNLLTAINGFAELIQSQQPPDSPFQ